jgi:S1-C subfamily serine protease
MINAATEALRIVRKVQVEFPTGPPDFGSGFLAPVEGRVITCAHVVVNAAGEQASRIRVGPGTSSRRDDARLVELDRSRDLAVLELSRVSGAPSQGQTELPRIGEQLVFAGAPRGVTTSSVFPAMTSAVGDGLLGRPRCELIQIAGMVNNGNSGGPLLNESGEVVGVITAKYVPLLVEIDKLTAALEQIPQFPSEVGIGDVDFSQFVNLTIRSMWQLAAVLRLVQVGTGWAVPSKFLVDIGGM